ncbi:nucleoid-associated protein [Acinetobacter sp. IK40]|jgi:nucleoid-associated protein|uniref:nucleoid-associated protein n=1 Tax=Acinetobacter sp. IK40 TaxID=2928897 RepID=UPI002D1EA09C|nr:nucleoid-associated protein [Acinetobacter sp. IK40]MEB3791509.1 nucleoid-associated protein [Acinetobacter sp. IK40]
MSIQHIIIHEVRRAKASIEDAEDMIISKIKDEENDVSKLDTDLAIGLVKLFAKASLYVGEFAVNEDTEAQPAFEQKLNAFYNGTSECSDFVEMTNQLAQHFEAILRKDKRINGGYLVFFEYESTAQTRLAVAVINKTKGTDVDNELNFVVREILDLDKLHLGATINIHEWIDGFSCRYIRFKKGHADEVRDYFEKFIGCTVDANAAKEETHQLKAAIEEFVLNELKQTQEHVDAKLIETHSYVTECLKNNEDVLLENVAKRVFPEKSEEFFTYASNKHNLSDNISISRGVLNNFKKVSSRNKDLSLSIARHLIGKSIFRKNGKLEIEESLLTKEFLEDVEKATQSLNQADKK